MRGAFARGGMVVGIVAAGLAPGGAVRAQTPPPGTSSLYTIASGATIMEASPDLNGDGYGDLLVGNEVDNTAAPGAGAVRVYSGQGGVLLYQFFGPAQGAYFGDGMDDVADLDGDGIVDIVIGVPFAGACSQFAGLEVFSGGTGTFLYSIAGIQACEGLGAEVAGGGDVDLDGAGDFAAQAFGYDTSDANEGAVRVYSGRDGSPIYQFNGDQPGLCYGSGIALDGDVDGDGRADLLVGSYEWNHGSLQQAGRLDVWSGANGSALYQSFGASAGDKLGLAVTYLGDITGDGDDEFLLSAPGQDVAGLTDAGLVMAMDPSMWSTLWTLAGQGSSAFLGNFLDRAGDIQGDGFPEALISERDVVTPASNIVHLVDATQGTIWGTIQDEQGVGGLGWAETGGQDFTGDGLSDFAVRLWPDTLVYQGNSLSVTGNPAPGATVSFDHNAPAAANDPFLVVLSFGQAGVPLGARTIPLSPDPLFLTSFGAPGLGGVLDGQGQASLPFTIPANPNLSGLTFYGASLLVDFAYPLGVQAITNGVGVTIL